MVADLHLHTTASDGSISAEKTLEIAYKRGLDYISITDHDSVDALDEALDLSENSKVKVIPGIEINSDYLDTEIHVLGYFIDHKSPALLELLKNIKSSRKRRAKKIIEKLNSLLDINLDMVELNELVDGEIITRSHIAGLLSKNNIVKKQ